MNAPGKILLYILAVFVLGAVLAPPLFWGAEKLRPLAEERGWLKYEKQKNGTMEPEGWAAFMAPDFAKVSNRAMLIAAVLLLWPLFRSLRIRSLAELGLAPNPHRWRDFATGWGISVAVMCVLAVILLQMGIYKMQEPARLQRLLGVAATGLTVGILEEWFFRGAILGSFRKSMGDYAALACMSAIFSIVHFLKPPAEAIAAADVGWLSGFAIIPQRFAGFSDPLLVLGGFTTLFCFGWVCGWAVLRTCGLALAVGFHAGMVLGKFGFNRVTTRPKSTRDLLPWLGDDMAVGLVAVAVVCIVGALLWCYTRSTASRLSSGQNT